MAAVVKGLFLLHSVFCFFFCMFSPWEEGRGWSINLKVVRSSAMHVKLSSGKILNPQLPPLECERQMLGSKCLGIEKKCYFISILRCIFIYLVNITITLAVIIKTAEKQNCVLLFPHVLIRKKKNVMERWKYSNQVGRHYDHSQTAGFQ